MQVKKFEARTMKEALEMVKTQMGPDAIILSARDNKKFGLVGEGSVEITAAVSQQTLQKKKFVESRFKQEQLNKFSQSPARVQKEIIEKMVGKHLERNQERTMMAEKKRETQAREIVRRSVSGVRYADIEDDFEETYLNPNDSRTSESAQRYWNEMQNEVQAQLMASQNVSTSQASKAPAQGASAVSNQRISTSSASQGRVSQPATRSVPISHEGEFSAPPAEVKSPMAGVANEQIKLLEKEIDSLRKVISDFQKVPQSFNSTYPGYEYGLNYEMSPVFEKLVGEGVDAASVASILTEVQSELTPIKQKNRAVVEGLAAKKFLDRIRIADHQNLEKVHLFVGPSGVGKTCSIIKMASHLILKERKKIAIVSTDTVKVGAAEQMKIFAQILNVPFVVVRDQNEWNQLLKHLPMIDHILVDYPGLALRSQEEIFLMRRILPSVHDQVRTHLVVSSKARDRDILETAKRYGAIHFDDLIFTGLDETTTYGAIYNVMERLKVPLFAFGVGSRVPEDFEFATRERLLDLIFRITQQRAQMLSSAEGR